MFRNCQDCEHHVDADNSTYSYCKADREMRLKTDCDDYNPKHMNVIIIGKDTFERIRYELTRITNIFQETPKSFVTTAGKSYMLCNNIDELSGRRADEVKVGRKLPLSDYIDSIREVIEDDFAKLSVV